MAKVIIEVKNLQNNDLIGKLVLSKTGRDKNHLYIVTEQIDENYLQLSNGSTKTVQMPKKKKLKHVEILTDLDEEIKSSIISKDRDADIKIRKFLKIKGIVKEG